ncbi:MAG TPA: GNAT family N-acetyltransferase [Caulobacteraceae bacterium]
MRLRPATANDAGALARIHAACFPAPWGAAQIGQLLGGPGSFGLLASAGRAASGFILCRVIADEAEVLTLATVPRHRRRGLARGLLAAGAEVARTGGATSLFLEVAEDNIPAVALYETERFVPVGRRARYYARPGESPVDALIMRRALNR